MSRYEFRAAGLSIVVGWDNPLETFFAQVWKGRPAAEACDPVQSAYVELGPVLELWVGAGRKEVPTLEALEEQLRPFAGVPEEIKDRLRHDFELRHVPSPLQRQLAMALEVVPPPAAERASKTYVFQVEETVRFWDEVEVRASSLEEARELAFETYYAGVECSDHYWDRSDQVSIEALPLGEIEQGWPEGGGAMAWRPHEYLIAGELDNRTPGRVTGWMSFVGLEDPVKFDLEGDFHRDVRGAKIVLSNPNPPEESADARAYMAGFGAVQTGKVGDVTAGLPPADYVDYPYLEWYSDTNGRVVLELGPEQVKVFGTPLDWQEQEPVSREEQGKNMGEFLSAMASSLSRGPEAAEEPIADFGVRDYGTLWEFTALSEPAKNFTREDLGLEPWQWIHKGCFALDHRPAARLVEQLREDGWRFAGPALEGTKEKEPMATSYERNYQCLTKLLGGRDHVRVENGGYMPLVVERLCNDMISLAHYGEVQGDLMADPEVVFLLDGERAKPVTYLNHYAGVEHATIAERFGDVPFLPQEQMGLDSFVSEWFRNLREQGFMDKAQKLHDERARAESVANAEQAKPGERGEGMMRPSDQAGVVAAALLTGATVCHEVKEALPNAKQVIEQVSSDVFQDKTERGDGVTEQAHEANGKENGKNKPIEKFSSGAVRVLVWDNGPDRESTLTLGRLYQDRAGEWRVAQSFRVKDVQDLQETLDKAVRAIQQGELGQKAKDHDVDRER